MTVNLPSLLAAAKVSSPAPASPLLPQAASAAPATAAARMGDTPRPSFAGHLREAVDGRSAKPASADPPRPPTDQAFAQRAQAQRADGQRLEAQRSESQRTEAQRQERRRAADARAGAERANRSEGPASRPEARSNGGADRAAAAEADKAERGDSLESVEPGTPAAAGGVASSLPFEGVAPAPSADDGLAGQLTRGVAGSPSETDPPDASVAPAGRRDAGSDARGGARGANALPGTGRAGQAMHAGGDAFTGTTAPSGDSAVPAQQASLPSPSSPASPPQASPGAGFAMPGTPPAALHETLSLGAAAPADPVSAPFDAQLSAALGSAEFAPALGVQLTLFAREGVQQARLHLHPVEMGPISVQIALDGTQAQVHFQADVEATRQALEASLPELASALREGGFTLTGGGVSGGGAQGGARDDLAGTPFVSTAPSTVGTPGAPDAGADGRPLRTARAQGVVDLYA